MWSAAERSRAGVITTSGTGGSARPPMNHSGISTPQSIGATASAGSLPPKLMPEDGTPASEQGFQQEPRERQLGRHVERDRRRRAGELARDAARDDDAHRRGDVDVVRGGDDHGLRPRRGEEPPELEHAGAGGGREPALLGRASLLDGKPTVRRDGGEDETH